MKKVKQKISEPQAANEQQPVTELPSGVDDIAAAIGKQAPEVQPGVVEAYARDEAAKPAAAPQPSPAPAQPGEVKRGRPRKPDSELKEPRRVKVPKAPQPQPGIPGVGNQVNQETAKLFTDLKESLTIAIIGDEWKLEPQEKAAENVLLTASLDRYAPAGMPVNPLVLYAAVTAGHAAKRFQQPKTRTWYGQVKARLAGWWVNRKTKKEAAKYAAHVNSRANDERKNDAGDSTGGKDAPGAPADRS